MSIRNEIFSISKVNVEGYTYKQIKILGIRLRFKITTSVPYKYKVNSRYLLTKTKVSAFHLDSDVNALYNYFLNSTDKSVDKMHHYFHIYNKHFERFKNKPVNILEIGVCKGGSLKMWKSYFGEQANVYGVDIDAECKQYEDLQNGIHVIIADQSNRDDLRNIIKKLPKIDIVIDDGGHTTNQQITTFDEIYDKISDDGVYLVEDLHTNYWKDFIDSKHTFIEYAKDHIDALNAWFFHSDDRYRDITNKEKMKMPIFTNITNSIHFYNSIIVFEKEKVCIPFEERR